ncbi:MAG: pilus assembly protein PilW [Methylotenera sp.]|nr:MAG: pilus assembly protein PilW [Methylotenera sp.]
MNISSINVLKSKNELETFQKGFSVIELMIAIAVGLLILVTLIALFLNINRTNEELAKTNSQIESGRFAIQLLQDDLIHAGFWGGYVPQFDDLTVAVEPADVPTVVPNPCVNYSTWTPTHKNNLIGISVQAYADTPPSGAGCVTDLSANKKSNTDVLVVRHAETCLPGEVNCEADVAGKLYFQSSQSYFLPLPRPIPEPNCPVTSLTSDAVPYVLTTAGFNTLHKKNCSTVITEKRKFVSNIYYVRDYASTEGDGIPTLMVSQFDLVGGTLAHQEAMPLVEGIEGFNVELGVDSLSDNGTNIITNADASKLYSAALIWDDPENLISPINRGDGRPDGAFIRCTDAVPCTPAQLTNTVVVKLYVLARADKVSAGYTDTKTYALGGTVLGPYNDGFKRHVFSTTVRLNNISGRRETP